MKKIIKSRTSVFQGKKVEYFKGKDIILALSKKKTLTHKSTTKEFKTLKQVTDFCDEYSLLSLITANIFKKVEAEFRQGEKRIPNQLLPCRTYKFDKDGYYIWNPLVQQVRWQGIFLMFLVIGIIAACCFPIWPVSAKLSVWYCSVVLLCIILGVTVIRYVVFTLFFIFGYDFWIIPNMYDDRAGFWDTFSPLYFFRKRDDSLCQVSVRVVVCAFVVFCCVYTYYHPEVIEAIQELSYGGVAEIVIWGENKILSVRVYLEFHTNGWGT